jgi:hypothetical protein
MHFAMRHSSIPDILYSIKYTHSCTLGTLIFYTCNLTGFKLRLLDICKKLDLPFAKYLKVFRF